jgi:hypothetical protein
MSLAVRALNESSVLEHLAKQLDCHASPAALHAAIIAEHIRTLVLAPFTVTPREHPIHTSRLIGALSRNTRFLAARADSFDDLQQTFTFVREQLVLCGDIAHIGNGYWIPCPMRAVRVAADHVYLFGGVPLPNLMRDVRLPVAAIGPSRYVRTTDPVNCPTLTLAQWVEHEVPLAAWAEHTLTCATGDLTPQADIEDDSLEIYAPDMYRALQRAGFWAPAREFREATPSLRLFRPRVAAQWVFDRPDYVGLFRQGSEGAQLVKAVRIGHDAARRLQFGLDNIYRTPRTLVLRRIGDVYRLEVKFPPFPEPESRVLGLGWREPDAPEALFFAASALPALHGVIELLGMRLYHA